MKIKNDKARKCLQWLSLFIVLPFGMSGAETAQAQWPWTAYGIEQTDNPCAIPTPYPEKNWRRTQYAAMKATDYASWNKNVVFLGDSITAGWNWMPAYPDGNGAKVLKEYSEKYPKVRPLSLGMSSDEPQNTLWLITEGNILESFKAPKVIVLLIGINSLNHKRDPQQVAGGIKTIVTYLRSARPESKILLLGILPCWGVHAAVREPIAETNRIIGAFADYKNVFFLNFGDKLLNVDGDMNPEVTYDGIHLTGKGYELWAGIMFPFLDDLVQTGGTSEMWREAGKSVGSR